MQRITLALSPVLLVPDGTDPHRLQQEITGALLDLEAVETVVIHGGATSTEPAREGTCRVGGHDFYAPYFFPTDRPVPDICPRHDQEEEDARVAAQHRPLFAEITRLSGLTPQIQDTGGGTMTIVIPVTPPAPSQPGQPEPDWPVPCYLGLVEDVTAQGHLSGTVDFYATREAIDSGEGDPVAEAPFGDPQHPHTWARQIAAHHQLTTGATTAQPTGPTTAPPAEPGPTSHS